MVKKKYRILKRTLIQLLRKIETYDSLCLAAGFAMPSVLTGARIAGNLLSEINDHLSSLPLLLSYPPPPLSYTFARANQPDVMDPHPPARANQPDVKYSSPLWATSASQELMGDI